MATVTWEDDIFSTAVLCYGTRISLNALKTLETVYGEHEVSTLQQMNSPSDTFIASWLSDEIIDSALKLLCYEFPNVHYLDCSTVKLYSMKDNLEHQPANLPFAKYHVLMPLNLHGSHWSLLVYQVKDNEFIHLDSSGRKIVSDPGLNRIKQNLSSAFKLQCQDANIIAKTSARQKDNVNCGVYVIHFAKLCAKGLPYTTPCDPTQLRQEIYDLIMKNCQ